MAETIITTKDNKTSFFSKNHREFLKDQKDKSNTDLPANVVAVKVGLVKKSRVDMVKIQSKNISVERRGRGCEETEWKGLGSWFLGI
ncbi:hypothetical protein QVD17_19125 [Tagetes erecta]|uniref:Uncharacterized protein n=1 Tax=Tagetes erecta TaxID=13708 RepID=A0AAD8KM06_TARER|nr:hypothetical protein QVD17_19125 [Tagetes erecta]